mmetsp:Transcript_107561/g.304165  ORF Transcript_107561/g.304165 Transcript_107561/m.304165 type:complete len:648 (-) Transcript_107561:56-1999(-)
MLLYVACFAAISAAAEELVRPDPAGINDVFAAVQISIVQDDQEHPDTGKEIQNSFRPEANLEVEWIHTNGHFNSLVTILIFTGLSMASFCCYCTSMFGGWLFSKPTDQLKLTMAPAMPKPRDDTGDEAEGPFQRVQPPESARIRRHTEVKQGDEALPVMRRGTWSHDASRVGISAWSKQRWSAEEEEQTMGSMAFILNIVADLCPSGFLSISYGMDGTGYIWAALLLVVFCSLCIYTMWTCGRTSEITGERDFASQWALVIGAGGAWIPLLVIVIVAFGALLCYACYFGDLLEEVMPSFGLHLPRYACLISFSLFPALPLCLLKSLAGLAYSSGFAVAALVYTAVVICVRQADGSYTPGGHYYAQLQEHLMPELPETKYLFKFGARSVLFINILAMAFHCHCNACKYYRELKDTNPTHFRNCTFIAMAIAAVLYAVIGFAGFATFGTNAHGTILKNYSLQDTPVNLARIFISLSLVASYAIMFSALREALIGLLKHVLGNRLGSQLDMIWCQDALTVVMVTAVTACAVVSQDSGLVDGFVGAFCGNAIIYIIPSLLYAASVISFLEKKRNRPKVVWSIALVVLGCILAIAGCVCLVVFEVEADPPHNVQHHWHYNPMENRTHHMVHNRNEMTKGHHRRHTRHMWSMR